MPKSKSKRRRYVPPPKPKPKPSPRWVGVLFFTLLGLGFVIILGKFIPGIDFLSEAQWPIFAGLGMIAAAFIVSTQWR
jgi:hypothetical protein